MSTPEADASFGVRRASIGALRSPIRMSWAPVRAFLLTVVIGGLAVGACLAALIPGTEALVAGNSYRETAVSSLRKLSQRSTVYDAAGNVIGQLGLQNREAVPLSQVPQVLVNAVVATEDKTFWKNDGIDIGAVFRAALKDFTSGRIEQGGSTITQQLVKNRILSDKRDLKRKIRELVLALRLNDTYTKKEILEQYLNTVYFGQGSYGVQSAAERFFRTGTAPFLQPGSLSNLTLGQAALLAGVISNPEGDNPFVYPDRAKARRSFVLEQMVKQKYATPAQAAAADNEPLPDPALKPTDDLRPRDAWTQQVQDSLFNDPRYAKALGATPQARRDAVLKGGLKIYATLDPTAQANAQNAIDTGLRSARKGFTSSLVAMDPGSGAVKAMIPGPDFATSQYNIATHPPGRQMGSTWKVVTLAAALMNGFSPNDSVVGTTPCSFKGYGQTANAEDGGGVMSIRNATKNSVNCAFARIELAVGLQQVMDMARKMGFTQDTLKPVLTLTLGTVEATPLEMATYMSTVASGGIHHAPYFVQKIVGPDGNTIFDQSPEGDRVLTQDVADCEIDLLHGVVTGGTGTRAQLRDGRPVFGKTGTTDDENNAAFYGGTYGQLVAFVWYGDKDANVSGAGFGGGIPAQIWKLFMDAQLAGAPRVPLPPPGPVCSRAGAAVDEHGRHAGTPAGAPTDTTPTSAPGNTPTTVAPTTAPPATTAPATPTTAGPPASTP